MLGRHYQNLEISWELKIVTKIGKTVMKIICDVQLPRKSTHGSGFTKIPFSWESTARIHSRGGISCQWPPRNEFYHLVSKIIFMSQTPRKSHLEYFSCRLTPIKIHFRDHVKPPRNKCRPPRKMLSQRADFIFMSVHPVMNIVSFPWASSTTKIMPFSWVRATGRNTHKTSDLIPAQITPHINSAHIHHSYIYKSYKYH